MPMLLPVLFLVQGVAIQPQSNIRFRDRAFSPTPVTDKDLRPMKPPDCRTVEEVQRTLEQLNRGEPGDCFIRDRTAFSRR